MGEIAANILKISRRLARNAPDGRTHARRRPDGDENFPVSANTGDSAPTPCRFPVDGGCAALRGYLRAFNPLTSIYIYTDKAALWAIGSSGVVFEWVENSMWFEGFSGKAGAESGDAESTR
jgi:hypothetical protein